MNELILFYKDNTSKYIIINDIYDSINDIFFKKIHDELKIHNVYIKLNYLNEIESCKFFIANQKFNFQNTIMSFDDVKIIIDNFCYKKDLNYNYFVKLYIVEILHYDYSFDLINKYIRILCKNVNINIIYDVILDLLYTYYLNIDLNFI